MSDRQFCYSLNVSNGLVQGASFASVNVNDLYAFPADLALTDAANVFTAVPQSISYSVMTGLGTVLWQFPFGQNDPSELRWVFQGDPASSRYARIYVMRSSVGGSPTIMSMETNSGSGVDTSLTLNAGLLIGACGAAFTSQSASKIVLRATAAASPTVDVFKMEDSSFNGYVRLTKDFQFGVGTSLPTTLGGRMHLRETNGSNFMLYIDTPSSVTYSGWPNLGFSAGDDQGRVRFTGNNVNGMTLACNTTDQGRGVAFQFGQEIMNFYTSCPSGSFTNLDWTYEGTSTTQRRVMSRIRHSWATSTDASRKARRTDFIDGTSEHEFFRAEDTGTAASVAWFGSAAVAQQTGDLATALSNYGLVTSPTLPSSFLTGTTTNNNAAAGVVGEYVTANVASGSAVSLTSTTTANVTSISLTAGDWDVEGVVDYVLSAATTTNVKSGSSSTSATLGGQDTYAAFPFLATLLTDTLGHVMPRTRFSLAAPTTVYLVAQATFSAGTVSAYGTIRARRVR